MSGVMVHSHVTKYSPRRGTDLACPSPWRPCFLLFSGLTLDRTRWQGYASTSGNIKQGNHGLIVHDCSNKSCHLVAINEPSILVPSHPCEATVTRLKMGHP